MRLRKLVKDVFTILAIAATALWWLPVRVQRMCSPSESLFVSSAQFLSLIPGKTGIYFRRGFYLMTLEQCAWDCFVEFGSYFCHSQSTLGNGVYLGPRCSVGMVDIGQDVLIGGNVDIISGRYQHGFGEADIPLAQQGGAFHKIAIGRNSWIGNSAIVMANVGHHAVIGAGSVVVKAIEPEVVAVGNPARPIRRSVTAERAL